MSRRERHTQRNGMLLNELLRILRADVELVTLHVHRRLDNHRELARVKREVLGSRMRHVSPKIRNIRANGEIFETMVPTVVTMKKLSAKTIEHYLNREQPFNCAGSAKIEKLGIALMKEVRSSDPTALIGLPLIETVNLLAKAGLEVIEGIGEA